MDKAVQHQFLATPSAYPIPTWVSKQPRLEELAKLFAISDGLVAFCIASVLAAFLGLSASQGLALAAATAAGWLLISFAMGCYRQIGLRGWASGVGDTRAVAIAAVILAWILLAAMSSMQVGSPALAAVALAGTTAVLAAAGRALVRTWVHRAGSLTERTIVVGADPVGRRLLEKLHLHPQLGLAPLGFLDDTHTPHTHGHLGRVGDLPEVVRTLAVDRVIIAFPATDERTLLECVRYCRDRGTTLDIIPRLFEAFDETCAIDSIGGTPLVSITNQAMTRSASCAKRLFDVVVATTALALLSPLLCAIAIAIKLDTRGSILFSQPRIGRYGQVFQLLKFRSMCNGAESQKDVLRCENDLNDGVMFKLHSDPRVTKVGTILRRFSLDELPQLLNVLSGEMSLVGPRPLVKDESDTLAEGWQTRRLELAPGITGPWQISGRNNTKFQEMVCLDYQYVANWSLIRDVEILLSTISAVISGRGAY
jgi:exopolysaccharide biosynthesis polyprenyl glycosylphosphotransferase